MRKLFNDMWVTELHSSDGATITIADHGAHVLSWKPAGAKEALYLSERSKYGANSAIRGGVPVIFPQFGERGSGQRHGFARLLSWTPDFAGIEQGRALARFRLSSEQTTGSGWPHRFELVYEVAVAGQELHMSLTVHNPSDQVWEFGAALHTYLHVSDLNQVGIGGLHNIRYLDQTRSGTPALQDDASLHIDAEIDRIYLGVAEPIVLTDADRVITIRKQGFSDAVIWNPGSEKSSQLADMAANDYRAFVCIEAGAVEKHVTLAAGERWVGGQSITVNQK
jgi:glucose-6-phosphate 1-epimerase